MTRLIIASALLLAACGRQGEEPARSTTQGELVVFAAEEYSFLVDTLSKEFARQYPEVRPSVIAAPTREAIVHLLNDSVSTICSDRPLNAEEGAVAAEVGIMPKDTRIAWDALVAVVNAVNRTPGFSRETLASIISGEVSSWRSVDGSGRSDNIEFVTTERNSGLYEVTQTLLLGETKPLSVFAVGASQRECVVYVGRSERAIAIVSMRAVKNLPSSVRIVPVEMPVDSTSGETASVIPSQLSVYTGEYGLRFPIHLITTERRSLTGSGFATFILTTIAQKIVQNAGLVPAVIPHRAIQLTSE